MTTKPRIALVLGDPAGIGPELIAKLLADENEQRRADVLLIADRDEVHEGMRVAGCEFPFVEVDGRTPPISPRARRCCVITAARRAARSSEPKLPKTVAATASTHSRSGSS